MGILIHNENCFDTMHNMPNNYIDVILTSPFYNTNKKSGSSRTLSNTKANTGQYSYVRYDMHTDSMTDDEYCGFTVNLFTEFNRVLKTNGVVLYNLSYGNENTEGMFTAINAIITQTPFTIADVITWKKSNALPNNCSSNRLTRITEFVFVFCRKNELKTFNCNKKVTSLRKTGQKMYENIQNYIEAKNNDGACPYNKATYSSDLCIKLLNIYALNQDAIIYDPFMGTGTTAVACKKLGLNCVGSEISAQQCEWAIKRLSSTIQN